MKTAVYAGSFDPLTLGHLDILTDGTEMFDKVIIAVADNSAKKCMLSVDERINLIKQCVCNLPNVEVDSYSGLTVDYAKKRGAGFLLRGLRSVSDFDYEMELAQNNRALCEDIKTVFLPTKPEHSFISSSAVREISSNNGDISKYVPQTVCDYFSKKSGK